MAFPDEPLDLRPELRVGQIDWVSVKGDAFTRDPITVTRGRADESSRPSASSCSMTLDNTTAKYSPRNPESPYYGGIGRNTPMRLSLPVDADSNYVHMIGTDVDGFLLQDNANLALLTGDIDMMIEIDGTGLVGRDQALISRSDPDVNQRSFIFGINSDGTLYFWFSDDGNDNNVFYGESEFAIDYLQGGTTALRVRIDHNNTDNAPDIFSYAYFYQADNLDGTWNQLGEPAPIVEFDSPTFHAGTAPVRLGFGRFFETDPQLDAAGNGLVGKIYRARFYDGWFGMGGVLIASPDFRVTGGGTTLVGDAQGNVWEGSFNLENGQTYVVDREYVYQGEVAEWPQRWEGSAGQSVRVELQAAGVLRRLTQGASALNSPYYRAMQHNPDVNLKAYWPCEDPAGSTQFASAVPGLSPMTITSVAKPEFSASDDNLFPASEQLPKIKGSTWVADFGALDWDAINGPDQAVGISFNIYIPTGSIIDNTVILRTSDSGTIRRWDITYTTAGSGTLTVRGYDSGGTVRMTIPATTAVNDKAGQFILGYHENLGTLFGNTRFTWLTANNTDTASNSQSTTVGGWLSGRPQTITINVSGGMSGDCVFGNLAVHDGTMVNTSGIIDGQLTAHWGEPAGMRFMRLCDEEGVPVRWRGYMLETELMGPQTVATLEELLFECVEAENGILFEPNDALGLGFRTRESLYNQAVHLSLDYTVAGEVMPPLEPDESDSGVNNRVVASRSGGSSFTAQLDEGPLSINAPPLGVGLYEESITLNVRDDAQLDDQAAWRLALGTVDDSRFPVVRINVREAPYLFGAAISTMLGDRLQIANPPKWLPPHTIDQIMQGTKTVYKPYDYSVEINCSPAAPWTVAVADDANTRADTVNSTISRSRSTTDTTLYVQTNEGPLWTEDPAEFPFDLNVDGELVTATAASPSILDTFTRTVANGWGTANTGGAWTSSGGSAADYSTNGTTGRISHGTRGVRRQMTTVDLNSDEDFQVSFSVSALPTWTVSGDRTFEARLYLRRLSVNDRYFVSAAVDSTSGLGTTGFAGLSIHKTVGGSESQIALLGVNVIPIVANQMYNLRFRAWGDLLQAKIWRDGFTEPDWMLSVTDTSHFAPDTVGVASYLGTNTTNTLPMVMSFDNFISRNTQKFTVVRSQNGVVKSLSTGADVRLAQPAITSF